MPSKQSYDQCMTWLRSQANNRDSPLDAINAEACISVITDLKRQRDQLSAMLYSNPTKNKKLVVDRFKQLSFEDIKEF